MPRKERLLLERLRIGLYKKGQLDRRDEQAMPVSDLLQANEENSGDTSCADHEIGDEASYEEEEIHVKEGTDVSRLLDALCKDDLHKLITLFASDLSFEGMKRVLEAFDPNNRTLLAVVTQLLRPEGVRRIQVCCGCGEESDAKVCARCETETDCYVTTNVKINENKDEFEPKLILDRPSDRQSQSSLLISGKVNPFMFYNEHLVDGEGLHKEADYEYLSSLFDDDFYIDDEAALQIRSLNDVRIIQRMALIFTRIKELRLASRTVTQPKPSEKTPRKRKIGSISDLDCKYEPFVGRRFEWGKCRNTSLTLNCPVSNTSLRLMHGSDGAVKTAFSLFPSSLSETCHNFVKSIVHQLWSPDEQRLLTGSAKSASGKYKTIDSSSVTNLRKMLILGFNATIPAEDEQTIEDLLRTSLTSQFENERKKHNDASKRILLRSHHEQKMRENHVSSSFEDADSSHDHLYESFEQM